MKNSVDHVLSSKKGGYVTFRHDVLVETEAELLREAKCRNVYIEPSLLPTSAQFHPKGTITADGARLDIVATGLYGNNEKTFMDVRITHPNAPSNMSTPVDKLLLRNETEKKTKYGSRIINTERASYIHSRALFRVACSCSPLSKGSIFLQPAQDTAREQVTFYLTSSDIARGPERYGPEHFQMISVPAKSPSASTYYFNFDNTKN